VNASVPARSNQSAEVRRGPGTFPRRARLLRHSDFERVYKQGRRHFSGNLTVFYLPRGGAQSRNSGSNTSVSGLRVGFTVGRALGGAVDRNRMKRRLREAVRLSRPSQSPDVDVVINPKKSVLKIDFEVLLNEVQRAFVVIEQKVGSGSGAADGREKIARPLTRSTQE
jgi:ribonuclease P protein component